MKAGNAPGEAATSGWGGNGRESRSGAEVKAMAAGRLSRLANRERTSERTACLRLSDSCPRIRDLTACADGLLGPDTARLAGA